MGLINGAQILDRQTFRQLMCTAVGDFEELRSNLAWYCRRA